jgi:hypothetical protein
MIATVPDSTAEIESLKLKVQGLETMLKSAIADGRVEITKLKTSLLEVRTTLASYDERELKPFLYRPSMISEYTKTIAQHPLQPERYPDFKHLLRRQARN